MCALYERGYGPESCKSVGSDGTGGTGGYPGSGGRGGAGGTSTSKSCSLSSCSRSGFIFSCATSSPDTSTRYNYDGSGNLIGWTTTVSYTNGNRVTCDVTPSGGSCTGSGNAQCSW